MTTRNDIKAWFEQGREQGATHLIVVVDDFDYTDYPVFVKPEDDIQKKIAEYDGKNMQRIMEVYRLSDDMETQLNERRAYNV